MVTWTRRCFFLEMMDFPLWLRISHLINAIFIVLIIRSGIEILSAHPKLYLKDSALNGTEWAEFTKKRMPKDKLWTSTDEEESFNSVVALPGQSHLGLGRHWHFFSTIFWVANGVAYYLLVFATGVWTTLIPTSWSIFPAAIHTMMIYASGHLPPPGNPFDPAQQLAYAGVVFILGPLLIITGALMSPAFTSKLPKIGGRPFKYRQVSRSLHFILMALLVIFIVIHLSLVLGARFTVNMANIIFGGGTMSAEEAAAFFIGYVVIVVAINYYATEKSLRSPNAVRNSLGAIVDPVRRAIFGKVASKQDFTQSDWSPYFRVNGRPPKSQEYTDLARNGFRNYRLEVFGLVENPKEFSLADLEDLITHEQTTEHQCIQGWTAIAEWKGVRVADIMRVVRPTANAKYLVFHSIGTGERDEYGHGDPSKEYYEIINRDLAHQPQTILAYEMNGHPLPIEHGAPLRLRVETEMGYKMVKWVKSIEFIADYKTYRGGAGGYREEVQQYGETAEI
jgi:methionine sulfoxide reductase catalytic subunit